MLHKQTSTYSKKRKIRVKASNFAPYFFFLAFFAVFLAALGTIITSKAQLRQIYI